MALLLAAPLLVAVPVMSFFSAYRHAIAAGRNSWQMIAYGKVNTMRMLRRFARGNKSSRTRRVAARLQRKVKNLASSDPGQIVVIGSSIIDYWRHMTQDLAPLPCLNAGAAGARTFDLQPFVEDLAVKLRPKVIVYYCGSNDVTAGHTASEVFSGFEDFYKAVKRQLGDVKFLYVGVVNCPFKKFLGCDDVVTATNAQIKAAQLPDVVVIDPNELEPRFVNDWSIYLNDGLHMKDSGYELLGATILPALKELYEKP